MGAQEDGYPSTDAETSIVRNTERKGKSRGRLRRLESSADMGDVDVRHVTECFRVYC